MGAPSTAALAERFETHLRFLDEQVVKPNNISATQKETQLLPRTNPAGLLTIPAEIRLQIYHYCLPRRRIVVVSTPCFDTSYLSTHEVDDGLVVEEYEEETSSIDYGGCDEQLWVTQENRNNLFLVSKQISEEALDYVYGENIFKLDINANSEHLLGQNFPEHNIRRMRSLLVIAQPRGVSYPRKKKPDSVLWSWLLPNLKVFRFVVQPPLAARGWNAPTLEEDMEIWAGWMKAFLECFAQHLHSTTRVEVDMDGRKETAELVEKFLPNGYRNVRCRFAGDFIFKRGRFMWGSDYWDEDDYLYPMNSHDV